MTEEIRTSEQPEQSTAALPVQPEQSAAERLGHRLSETARDAAGMAARVAVRAVPGGPAAAVAVDGSRALGEAFRARAQGNPAPTESGAGEWTAAASTAARRTSTTTASTGIPEPYRAARPHVPATADSSIQVARKSALKAALRAASRRSS